MSKHIKIFAVLFFGLFICFFANAQSQMYEPEMPHAVNRAEMQLKGRVKYMYKSKYEVYGGTRGTELKRKAGSGYYGEITQADYHFNEEGILTEENHYTKDDKFKKKIIYILSDSLLIGSDEYRMYEKIISRYAYNTSGRITESRNKHFFSNSISSSLKEQEDLMNWDKGEECEVYKYTPDNKLSQINSSYSGKTVFLYDTENNSKQAVKYINLRIRHKTIYQYGEDDVLLTKTKYEADINDRDSLKLTQVHTFNSDGQLTNSTVSSNSNKFLVSDTIHYEYNEYGDLISSVRRNKDGKEVQSEKYTYEYDEYGNWTKQCINKGGYTYYCYVRTFEYYKEPE